MPVHPRGWRLLVAMGMSAAGAALVKMPPTDAWSSPARPPLPSLPSSSQPSQSQPARSQPARSQPARSQPARSQPPPPLALRPPLVRRLRRADSPVSSLREPPNQPRDFFESFPLPELTLAGGAKIPRNVLINGILAGSLCTWAALSVLNVDSEVSRGWTHLEVLSRLLSDNWIAYEGSLREDPVLTKVR